MLGILDARANRRVDAVAIVEHMGSMRQRYVFGRNAFLQARIAAALGQNDNALALLREAFAEGMVCDPWLHTYPEFTPLRNDPKFRKLLNPKG